MGNFCSCGEVENRRDPKYAHTYLEETGAYAPSAPLAQDVGEWIRVPGGRRSSAYTAQANVEKAFVEQREYEDQADVEKMVREYNALQAEPEIEPTTAILPGIITRTRSPAHTTAIIPETSTGSPVHHVEVVTTTRESMNANVESAANRERLVADFLARHRYATINSKKTTGNCCGGTRTFEYPLHTAVREGSNTMVQALLMQGVDKTKRDDKGRTAAGLLKKDSYMYNLIATFVQK